MNNLVSIIPYQGQEPHPLKGHYSIFEQLLHWPKSLCSCVSCPEVLTLCSSIMQPFKGMQTTHALLLHWLGLICILLSPKKQFLYPLSWFHPYCKYSIFVHFSHKIVMVKLTRNKIWLGIVNYRRKSLYGGKKRAKNNMVNTARLVYYTNIFAKHFYINLGIKNNNNKK